MTTKRKKARTRKREIVGVLGVETWSTVVADPFLEEEKTLRAEIKARQDRLGEIDNQRNAKERAPFVGRYFRQNGLLKQGDGWDVWTRVDRLEEHWLRGLQVRFARRGELYDLKPDDSISDKDMGREVTRAQFEAMLKKHVYPALARHHQ